MTEPRQATQKAPYPIEVEEGKQYYWCACGRSKKQPLCDGAHKGTGITPIAFTPTENGTVYLCGCRRTRKEPWCDGSHEAP